MIKTGDRVRFLNDVGGGIVKGFVSKNIVNVENEDGFEIPTLITELVVIKDEENQKKPARENHDMPRVKVPEPVKKTQQPLIIDGKDQPSFYFAFVPEIQANPIGGNINAYLVNNSNFTLLYHYCHERNGIFETVKTGKISPNSKAKLEIFVQSDLSNLPGFGFTLLPYLEKSSTKVKTVSKSFQINPVKFYKEKSFISNELFTGNAMLLEISENLLKTEMDKMTETDIKEVFRQKEAESDLPRQPDPKQKAPEIIEVDLHIHQLIESTAGLENKDIIEIQMKRFFDEMDQAIKSGTKRVVFIHGIGQGTLKNEIRKELSSRYKKYYFQDASFKEYGYGATMVIIKK